MYFYIGGIKDIDGNASVVEFDITMDPPEILSSTDAAANSVEVKEASMLSLSLVCTWMFEVLPISFVDMKCLM